MTSTSHIQLRDARDRIIDLLAIGQTYPLQDLAVPDDQLTVAFNTEAQIPIEESQEGVLYQLHDDHQEVKRPSKNTPEEMISIRALGNGSRIALETDKIHEDITFDIFARKIPWYLFHIDLSALTPQQRASITRRLNNDKMPEALRGYFFSERGILIPEDIIVTRAKVQDSWVIRKTGFEYTYRITKNDKTLEIYQTSGMKGYLHESATVKVGLDLALQARITNAARLVVENQTAGDSSPYIIDYAGVIKVEVMNSQEGVVYKLVSIEDENQGQTGNEIIVSERGIRGDLSDIVLTSKPIHEDVDIRIRATKTFDPSENRPEESALLEAILPLRVRANPGLDISTTSDISDYDASVKIRISNSQLSASYQVYIGEIADQDYIHPVNFNDQLYRVHTAGQPEVQILTPFSEVVEVTVSQDHTVLVSPPDRTHPWKTPQGFSAWGTAQLGNGGDIEFSIDNLKNDKLVIVQAEKLHRANPVPPIPTAVQMEQSIAILVRPNPEPALTLEMISADELILSDGQPGVFYTLFLQPNGDELGLPAYFHKADMDDETCNKGLGQINLEVDFCIAGSINGEQASGNLDRTRPGSPIVEIDLIPADTPRLYVRATNAQSKLETWLKNPLDIPPE
jgi:hypothetical protein